MSGLNNPIDDVAMYNYDMSKGKRRFIGIIPFGIALTLPHPHVYDRVPSAASNRFGSTLKQGLTVMTW